MGLKAVLQPGFQIATIKLTHYPTLLSVLTASPDAETAMEGTKRLSHILRDRADNLRNQHDQTKRPHMAYRLGNP